MHTPFHKKPGRSRGRAVLALRRSGWNTRAAMRVAVFEVLSDAAIHSANQMEFQFFDLSKWKGRAQ